MTISPKLFPKGRGIGAANEAKRSDMQIKKILLKDRHGRAQSAATLTRDRETILTLPTGYRLVAVTANGRPVSFDERGALTLSSQEEITFLAEKIGGEIFTGSTLPPKEATFRTGLLLAERERAIKGKKSLASPLREPSPAEKAEKDAPTDDARAQEEESLTARFGITAVEGGAATEAGENGIKENEDNNERAEKRERSEEERLLAAEALLDAGTPFTLFEELIEGSRWARIEQGGEDRLIGILEDGDTRQILYGRRGNRSDPPKETECAFFPTDDEGDEGWYVTAQGFAD